MEQSLEEQLRKAGFVGVDSVGSVTYARSDAAMPEFSVEAIANAWLFSVSWQYRANTAQRADWVLQFKDAPMDVALGETRVQKSYRCIDGAALADWTEIVRAMVAQCIKWRRITRQGDEGC